MGTTKGVSKLYKDSGKRVVLNRDRIKTAEEAATKMMIPSWRLGFDVSEFLYRSSYRSDTKGKGSHLRTFFEIIVTVHKAGCVPIFVLDGTGDHDRKKVLSSRRLGRWQHLQQTIVEILGVMRVADGGEVVSHRREFDQLSEVYQKLQLAIEAGEARLGSGATIGTAAGGGGGEGEAGELDGRSLDEWEATQVIVQIGKTLVREMKDRHSGFGVIGAPVEIEGLSKKLDRIVMIPPTLSKELIELFQLTGTSYVRAPGEADILLSQLCVHGAIDAVVSDDADLFAFGAPRIIRGFNQIDFFRTGEITLFELPTVLRDLGLNMDQLRDIAIICGTDFNYQDDDGKPYLLKKVAAKTAHTAIRTHGSIEAMLRVEKFRKALPDPPELFNYEECRAILKEGLNRPPPTHLYTMQHRRFDGGVVLQYLLERTNYRRKTVEGKIEEILAGRVMAPKPIPIHLYRT